MTARTDIEARQIAATMLRSVPRLTLDALHILDNGPTYEALEHGDVRIDLTPGTNRDPMVWRKILVEYRSGLDVYDVTAMRGRLDLGVNGTCLDTEAVAEWTHVYGDQLGDLLIEAARKLGLRPQIADC